MFEKTPENEAEKKKIQGKVFIFAELAAAFCMCGIGVAGCG